MVPLLILSFIISQVYEVEGVVVTATRYPASLKDISAGTMVINKEMIESLNPLSLGEVLRNLAGIDSRDYGNPGSVSSISIRGTPSSGVIILLDGMPLNSIQTGIADVSLIDINSVERIEIIKAPVSNLYGANGIGGVINIITENIFDSTIAVAKIKQGAGKVSKKYHTSEYFLKYSLPGKHFNYKITGKKAISTGGRTNNDYAGFSIDNQLSYRNSDFVIQLKTLLNHRNYGIPGPLPLIDSLHAVPYLGDSTSSSKFDNQSDDIWLNDLSLNFKILKNLSLSSSLFGNITDNHYHTKYFFWDIVSEDYNYSLITLGSNNSFLWEMGNDKLIFGFDFRYDTLTSEKKSSQSGDTVWFANAKNYGYWISLVKRLMNKYTVNTGLRYDRNTSYGDFISPSLGFVSEINKRLWLKFSLGKAFRAPGFNDLYWPKYGNKDLKPEYGNAYEIHVESSPVYNMFTGFSLFLRDIKDRITWLPTNEGFWKPQNVNYIKIAGAETEVHLKFNKNLKITLDGTYLYARQRNHELIYYDFITSEIKFEEVERKAAFIPDFTLSVGINYTLPNEILLDLRTEYTSSRLNYYENWNNLPNITMDTKRLKSYFLVNLNLSKKLFNHLYFSTGIKNLLDTSYAIQFGNGTNDRDYPMPGRTLFAQMTWN
ncbi:MAG: TonB-dependent receptor [candidate division WOR-3 bacterium]